MKLNEYQISMKNAKENLIKGYTLVKYTKKAFNPHKKRVFIDEECKELRWKDID